MAVNLSPAGGVAAQFFTNTGIVLTGGKLYTYAAGTTTPAATYTTSAGSIAHANPIILDSSGRVSTGEIWLTNGSSYKFVLKDSNDVLIATYDNVTGIGDTSALLAYEAAVAASSGSSLVGYTQGGTGAVATTVQAKLRQTVSVKDFGAVGDGTTNDTTAFANAVTTLKSLGGGALYIPKGIYKYTNFLIDCSNVHVYGDGIGTTVLQPSGWVDGIRFANGYPSATALLSDVGIQNITLDCVNQTVGTDDTYGNGINFNACDQFDVRFCEVIKHKQQGIVSTYYQVGSVKETAGYITDNIVDSALSSSNISIGVEGNSSNVTVTNNTIFNAVNVGIYCGNLSATLTAGNVIISNNNVSCVTGDIGIRVEDVYKSITITGNQISNFDVGIRGSTTAGAATDTYLISNNLISGFIHEGILLSPLATGGSNRSLVIGNSLLSSSGAGSSSYAIYCASDAHITGNYINANTVSSIYASGTNITIQSNTCLNATGSYSIDVSATTSAVVIGNFLSSDLYLGTTTQATANLGGTTQRWTQNYMGTKQFIPNPNTNSAPVSGTWVAGDIVWNANPASGGYVGLICTVSGTPGTWKTFGLIS